MVKGKSYSNRHILISVFIVFKQSKVVSIIVI